MLTIKKEVRITMLEENELYGKALKIANGEIKYKETIPYSYKSGSTFFYRRNKKRFSRNRVFKLKVSFLYHQRWYRCF